MAINFPEGTQSLPSNIIQVQQTVYTGIFSMSGNWATITGLNCAITPKTTSSRIIVCCHIGILSYEYNTAVIGFLRNSSAFYVGAADGNRERVTHRSDGRQHGDNNHGFGVCAVGYDSPNTTSSTTYGVRMTGEERNKSGYVNRHMSNDNNDNPRNSRTTSSMTLIEYAPS